MVNRPKEGVDPVGVLGSKADSLTKSINRSVGFLIYVIATLAVFTVAVLAGLVILQYNQNNKIDSALRKLNSIAADNNRLENTNSQNTALFGGAVESVRAQINGIRATDNETLYRVKQLEKAVLGYIPPVPPSVIKQGQVTVTFNRQPSPSPSPQPAPSPQQAPNNSQPTSKPTSGPRPKPSPSKSRGIIPAPIPLPLPTPSLP